MVVLVTWLLLSAWFIVQRWGPLQAFALPDTDDNLRMAQVRAWMAGQDWYDLRQYRFNPPAGADIHWSRLVDLPLAALITIGRWFMTGAAAERMAVAVAPLLPYLVLLFGLALLARRLIAPGAFLASLLAAYFAASMNGMFMPLRIDHHGWQLAFLILAMAGLADPKRARGGATTGIATALSLSVGLEMLIYLAIAGAAQVMMWVDDAGQRRRIAAYGVGVAGGTGLGYLLFASTANRLPVCDALSPVWLSDAVLGGALLLVLAWLSPPTWTRRLLLAAAAGGVVALFHALAWPQCLSRLEGVSPEVQELWLDNVREARPIYKHSWRIMAVMATMPVIGLIGWGLLAWMARGNRDLLRRTAAVGVTALAAALLLLWQTRAGPAAQALAITGCAGLVWTLAPKLFGKYGIPGALATAAVILVGSGATVPVLLGFIGEEAPTAAGKKVNRANNLCPSLAAMRPVARQPKGTVFTFVDLAPRIISVTHHSSIAGPYHRNDEAIGDVMKAFRGTPEQAREIISRYRADYLLICPDMSQATVFRANAPKGFYIQLERGRVPAWLKPVDLGKDSPLRMWRVVR